MWQCRLQHRLYVLSYSQQVVKDKVPVPGVGGNVNQPVGASATTPLMAAAGGGHLSCTQQLLDCNADVAYSALDGTTALMAAASGGHGKCVAALIRAGVALNNQDHSGMSAIMLAAAAGHVSVVRCLIRHGAALERLPFQVQHNSQT